MIARRHLLALVALEPMLARADASLITAVRERLADAAVLRGDFEQRKLVKGFRHALISRGEFVIARDRGVLWRTREPFAQSLLVTRDSLVARGADGKTMTRLDATQEPALRAVNQTLFALLGADLNLLGERFAVEAQLQGGQGWRLVLLPRDRQIAQWLERVELEGARFVHQVQFAEKSGDTTQILFSRQQTADALSADEEAAFA